MKITEMRLDEIRPYENNPRLNDDAVDYVAQSIQHYGWKQPLVVDRGGRYHRWAYPIQGR